MKRSLSPLLDGILLGRDAQPKNTSVSITFQEIPEGQDCLIVVQAYRYFNIYHKL